MSQQVTYQEELPQSFQLEKFWLPGAVALVVIVLAVVAGFVIGPGGNTIIGQALSFSSGSTNKLSNVGIWLPFGFAFGAGMVATVNPCGFVMLPAYLGMYVGDDIADKNQADSKARLVQHLVKALYVSVALGLGFVVLFGAVGLLVSAGARSVATAFPWISLTLGFGMTLLGAYLFAGGKLYTGVAQSAASHIGDPRDQSLRGYFLFGISYATASLSCTLPIFLGIVTASLASDGVAGAVTQFLAYALGMAFVITVLTISIAIFKGALVNQFRKLMPYLNSISAGILIVVGGYLIFYWLTEGELIRHFGVG
ncbi:MAG: cytochrome c biogenesis protein CcdA [Chloroflexi bacterium]|nr:cytochrome c biogenesis protein CcdA [Chloroflexota bacterium]